VLEHLLKSGAGTVFHESIDPVRRPALTREFLELPRPQRDSQAGFDVRHDSVA
jgi:hypothetical protein